MDHNHPELGSGVWRIKYHVRRTASGVIEHEQITGGDVYKRQRLI